MTRRAAYGTAAGAAVLALALSAPVLGAWVVGGNGPGSATATSLGTPGTPTTSSITTSAVTLSWAAPTNGPAPARYVVSRNGSPISSCAFVTATATSCTDSGLSASTQYTYTVAAALQNWTSPQSASVTATTQANAPTDTTPPTVASINRSTTSPTAASSVSWAVTFSESVTGVDTSDFALVQGTGLTGAAITGVSGSGATWTVTASTGTGSGSLGLNLVDDDTIKDSAANPLGGAGSGNGSFTGQVYTIDKAALSVTVTRAATQAAITNSSPINFTVTFSKPVSDFTAEDVTLSGAASPTTAIVSGSGTTYNVAVSGMTAQGTVSISVGAGKASDGTGGTNTASTGNDAVTWDTVAPSPTAVTLTNGSGTAGTVDPGDSVRIRFSEALNATSICSTFVGTTGSLRTNNVVVTLRDNGASDIVSVSASDCAGGLHVGEVATGANYLDGASRTFSATANNDRSSVVLGSDNVLVVTLGKVNTAGGTATTGVASSTPVLTPDTAVKDQAGNRLGAAPYTGGSSQF